jgi:hypothetical protein
MMDAKPTPRTKDPDLMRILHADPTKECALTEEIRDLEIHHVLPRSQRGDDVRENLVWLTAERHRAVTRNDADALRALGQHIRIFRPDTIAYIKRKLGEQQGAEWLRRRLYIEV